MNHLLLDRRNLQSKKKKSVPLYWLLKSFILKMFKCILAACLTSCLLCLYVFLLCFGFFLPAPTPTNPWKKNPYVAGPWNKNGWGSLFYSVESPQSVSVGDKQQLPGAMLLLLLLLWISDGLNSDVMTVSNLYYFSQNPINIVTMKVHSQVLEKDVLFWTLLVVTQPLISPGTLCYQSEGIPNYYDQHCFKYHSILLK